MPVRISELFGYLLGWPLGLFFAAGSILRNARFFHPRGLLFCAHIESVDDSLPLPLHAIVRFSGAWWKHVEWPDVLGLTIRLSEKVVRSASPKEKDQDLLFATFQRPWQIFAAPFFTEHHDYLANTYFAISPFRLPDGRIVDFMVNPSRGHRSGGSRDDKLLGNVLGGRTMLRLMMKERKSENWKMVARIHVEKESDIDQEALRFHPFHAGQNIRPFGFLHYLRIAPYRMSQRVRPGSEVTDAEVAAE
ncbi:MAG: hypothetical protein ACJ76H_11940 [Bacteriovoracaceae bacterium]